jgi:hypothetical protein
VAGILRKRTGKNTLVIPKVFNTVYDFVGRVNCIWTVLRNVKQHNLVARTSFQPPLRVYGLENWQTGTPTAQCKGESPSVRPDGPLPDEKHDQVRSVVDQQCGCCGPRRQ